MKVVEAKDLFADGGELLDGSPEMFSKFLIHDVLTWGGIRVSDTAFRDSVQWFDSIRFLLFSEIINTGVFGDAVKP